MTKRRIAREVPRQLLRMMRHALRDTGDLERVSADFGVAKTEVLGHCVSELLRRIEPQMAPTSTGPALVPSPQQADAIFRDRVERGIATTEVAEQHGFAAAVVRQVVLMYARDHSRMIARRKFERLMRSA